MKAKMLAVLAFAALSTEVRAQTAKCISSFYFDEKPIFGLSELASILEEKNYRSEDMYLNVMSFNYDTQPWRKNRYASAVVYGGDIGDDGLVVGGVLWATHGAYLDERKTDALNKKGDAFYAAFEEADVDDGCPRKTFVLKFDKTRSLYADGKKIGQIEPYKHLK